MNQHQNPLLRLSDLPHRAVPFDQIQTGDFLPALDWAIQDARTRLDKIKQNQEAPSFVNTIEALEMASERVDWVASVFFNLLGAHTNDTLQALAQEFSPRLSAFSSDLLMDQQLFERVRAVHDQRSSLSLDHEQARLLENTYLDFIRNGALLDQAGKTELRELDQELSKLGPQFGENILKATNEFEMLLSTEEDLVGLPESVLDAARAAAEAKGHKGLYLFNLQAPSYIPFMQNSKNRALREKMFRAYNARALQAPHDNRPLVQKIVTLRHRRAELLGYASHAQFVLERRMAQNPSRVEAFLHRLLNVSRPAAERELSELKAFAHKVDGLRELERWDVPYYSERLKEQKFSFSDEELRPYFKLETTLEGVFKVAAKLFDLEFRKREDLPTYHPEVEVYEVFQNNNQTLEFMGLLYTDFFPRESKRGGAWMTTYYEQGHFAGHVMRPHVSIVCNFTKPSGARPSLLTFDEVRTIFHEFGHALHALLSRCHYRSLAGTNVHWDFVELPSQIFENWTLEKAALDLFAQHYQTQAPLPVALIEKVRAANQFQAGLACLRQLTFAMLDMAWHTRELPKNLDVEAFEREVTQDTSLLAPLPGTNISVSFSHVFAGGYSAGYYSYKWAEVLDADAFELFLEKGIFDRETSRRFEEHVLSRGGSEPPMELFRRFRGREPDPDALLRREGLL